MEQVKAKYLGKFFFKSKSMDGTLCKTYVWLYANGVTIINQLFLVEGESNNPAWTKLYSKFGKTIYATSVSFKYSSLITIMQATTNKLQEEGVKATELL